MGMYLDEANKWKEFVREFGEPEEVSRESLSGFEPNRVWTLWSRASRDFLANETGDGAEAMSYWVTPRPWTQPQRTFVVAMRLWVPCPKCEEGMDSDENSGQDACEECEGSGCFVIEMDDCVDAKTDEEVWAKRQISL